MFTADEVHQKLSDFRLQLEKFHSHCSDLEVCFRDEDHGFKDINTELTQKLRDLLTQGQQKLFLIEEGRRDSEAQKIQHLEDLEAERVAKENKLILGCASGLQKEIDVRSKALLKKLVVDLSTLNDFEILNKLKPPVSCSCVQISPGHTCFSKLCKSEILYTLYKRTKT